MTWHDQVCTIVSTTCWDLVHKQPADTTKAFRGLKNPNLLGGSFLTDSYVHSS